MLESFLWSFLLSLSSFFTTTFDKQIEFQLIESDSGELSLPAGEYRLDELIRLASKQAGINYVDYDASGTRGRFSSEILFTQSKHFANKKAFSSFVEKTLGECRIGLIPLEGIQGQSFRLISLAGSPQEVQQFAQSASLISIDELDQYEGRPLLVMARFELKNLEPNPTASWIREFFGQHGIEKACAQYPNGVIVSTYPSTMRKLAVLLRQADVASTDKVSISGRVAALEKRLRELEKAQK